MRIEGQLGKNVNGKWHGSIFIVRGEGENDQGYQQMGYGRVYAHPSKVGDWKGSKTAQEEIKKMFDWLQGLNIYD